MRILRELLKAEGTSPISSELRRSFHSIAQKVGVDEETVRHRVKRFHQLNLIEGWRTILNPNLIGKAEVVLWMDVNPSTSKDAVVEKIRLLPGVILIGYFYGTLLGLILRYQDEVALARQIELIRKIADLDACRIARVPFPPCNLRLWKTDWEILRSLRRDPRKSYATVSRELGLSSRTVKRRVQRMIDAAAVFAFAALNPKAAEGRVMAILFVTYPPERKGEIDRIIAARLDIWLWHILHMLPYRAGDFQTCAFNLLLPGIGKAQEILRWARTVPGILEARIELFEGSETLFRPLEEEIERGIAQSSKAREDTLALTARPP